MFLVTSKKTGRLKKGMENGDGDEDGGRMRETRMEDGNVYGVLGAHHVKPCITTI